MRGHWEFSWALSLTMGMASRNCFFRRDPPPEHPVAGGGAVGGRKLGGARSGQSHIRPFSSLVISRHDTDKHTLHSQTIEYGMMSGWRLQSSCVCRVHTKGAHSFTNRNKTTFEYNDNLGFVWCRIAQKFGCEETGHCLLMSARRPKGGGKEGSVQTHTTTTQQDKKRFLQFLFPSSCLLLVSIRLQQSSKCSAQSQCRGRAREESEQKSAIFPQQ